MAGRTISPEEFQVRIAEVRQMTEEARRRHGELIEEWSRARTRRSELRSSRMKIRADIAMRRTFSAMVDRRSAAAILEAAVQVLDVPLQDLWVDYVGLGGNAAPDELATMISGVTPLGRLDHDRLVIALNQRLCSAGHSAPLAYWDGTR